MPRAWNCQNLSVDSEFYPELDALYRHRIAAWAAKHHVEDEEEEDEERDDDSGDAAAGIEADEALACDKEQP